MLDDPLNLFRPKAWANTKVYEQAAALDYVLMLGERRSS